MPNNNIYDVYIQHWYNRITRQPDSGSEKLMFSIPYSNPEGFPVVSPSVKCSEDSADSLDFTLNTGMEYYDLLIPFITLIRVEYYGNTIFNGRVLTINPSTILQTKSVHCEGAYAFMNDSFYPAIADSKREELDWVNSSNNGYFDKILSNHNTYIDGDEHKKFYKGTIDSSLSGKKKKYEPTGWSQTSSLLSSLKDEIGGHMLARYSGGYNYLDWYKYAKRDLGDSRPRVEVGENVIDISGNMDVGNLFTRVIPVGKNDNDGTKMSIAGYRFTNVRTSQEETIQTDYMPVSTVLKLYQDSDLTNDYHTPDDFTNSEARHSIIYKTVQFSDAATQKELFEECAKWIKESYYGAVTSLEIRAIDMKIVNSNVTEPILIGDCVDIYYKIVENGQMVTKYRKMVCKSVKYDLFNPSNNSYTFGIPSDLLKVSKSQSTSNKKKTASQTMSTPNTDDTPPDTNLTFQKIADIIRNDPDVENGYGGNDAADSFISNGEYSGSVKVYDATIHYDTSREEIFFTARLAGKITVDGKPTHWVGFNNAHGLFAFPDVDTPLVVGESSSVTSALASAIAAANQKQGFRGITHWYIKNGGYSYTNIESLTASAKTGAIAGAGQFVMSDLTKQFYLHSAVEGGMIGGMMTIDPQALNKVKVKRTMLTSAAKGALTFLNAEVGKQNTITAFFGNKDDNSGGSMQIMDDAEKKIAEVTKSTNGGGFLNLLSSSGLNSLQALADDVKNRITTSTKKDGKDVSTTTIDGVVGSMCSIFGKLGTDGSGDDSKTTITNDGTTGKSTFFDLNGGSSGSTRKKTIELAAGSSAMSLFNGKTNESDENKRKTVELDGNDKNNDGTSDTSIGKIKVGKNLAAGAAAGFKVVMNESQAYKGYRVNSQGQGEYFDTWGDGFVFANDLKLDSIPSFKTEKAVIDKLWADQATVNSLTVNNDAWIKDLTGETAKVAKINAKHVRAGEKFTTPGYVSASDFELTGVGDEGDDGASLKNCFSSCLFTPETDSSGKQTGRITATFGKIGGGTVETSFNMADTAWYKSAVSAVAKTNHNKGGATAYAIVSPVSLNPGGSSTITAYYTDYDGHAVNTGRTYTVSARSLDNDPDLTVTPGALQVFTAAKDGYKKVTVNAAPSVSHNVSNFDVGTNQGESSPRWGKSNASNQYYGISGAKTANVAVWIVLHAWWTCGGTSMNPNRNDDTFRSYLQAAPTAVYKRGWNDCIEKAKSNSSWTVPGTSTTYYLLPTTL